MALTGSFFSPIKGMCVQGHGCRVRPEAAQGAGRGRWTVAALREHHHLESGSGVSFSSQSIGEAGEGDDPRKMTFVGLWHP